MFGRPDAVRPHIGRHGSRGPYRLARRMVLPGLLAVAAAATARAAPREGPAALRKGGHILYLRHAHTVMHTEPKVLDLSDCAWQRNLAPEGRAEAESLRQRIRELGIPVGPVLSSAFCRARDTAEIVFGGYDIWAPLTYHANQTPAEHRANVDLIRARLGQRPPPLQTLVMIGHEPGLRDATGIRLSEGEGVILEPAPNGDIRELWHLTAKGLHQA